MRLLIAIAILICGFVASATAQQPATVPVGTIVAARKPIAKTADFVGRVQAIDRVEVHARVDRVPGKNTVQGRRFSQRGPAALPDREGLVRSRCPSGKRSVSRQASFKKLLTAIQYERAEQLVKTNTGTVVARYQALTADRAAAAQVMIDKANLDTSEINLGYTGIVSPINGKIGRSSITKGNVVTPQSGTLTTIVSQDPMYVLFPVSQPQIMRARAAGSAADVAGIKSRLRFPDGSSYGEVGRIDFIDVTVDRATDTVQVRAVFPNLDGVLTDGQLVTVNLEFGTAEEQVLVPQAALITDQQGVYVFIVENGKAAIRRIKTGGASGEDIVVTEGLAGGSRSSWRVCRRFGPEYPAKPIQRRRF